MSLVCYLSYAAQGTSQRRLAATYSVTPADSASTLLLRQRTGARWRGPAPGLGAGCPGRREGLEDLGVGTSGLGGLGLEIAPGCHAAVPALGLARLAHIAPVQDQPVVRVHRVGGWHPFEQLLFHFERVLARGQSGAVADPEDVGVHRHGGFTKGH